MILFLIQTVKFEVASQQWNRMSNNWFRNIK